MDNLLYLSSLESRANFRVPQNTVEIFEKLSSKAEINKMFFELYQKPVEYTLPKMELIQATLEKAAKASRDNAIRGTEHKISILRERSVENLRDAERAMREASSLRLEIEALANGSMPSFKEILLKVHSDPFWKIGEIADNVVTFNSQPVICRYKDTVKGIDMTVSFGVFQARWNVATNNFICVGVADNLEVSGYNHPHISGGRVCWGTAADTVTKALIAYDIHPVLKALQIILHTYNPDSPYVELTSFWLKQNPQKLENAEVSYEEGDKVWIYESYWEGIDCSHTTEDSFEDDDGETRTIYRIRTYNKIYTMYGIPAGTERYYKTTEDEYLELDEDEVYES